MNKLPITTQKKNVEIKAINGQQVFDLREQIINILSRDADPGLVQDFFAEPVVNEVKGEVSWYTQAAGPVRPFRDLNEGEREQVIHKLQRIDGQLKASADKISVAGSQLGWLSDATRAMLSVPDLSSSLFLVGDTPVLTQWGCIPFGANPALHQIIVSDAAAPKTIVEESPFKETAQAELPGRPSLQPPLGATAAPATVPNVEGSSAKPIDETNLPDNDVEAEPVQPTTPVESSIFNWRDHIAALLCLLLLLLLFIGVYLNYHYTDPNRMAAIETADIRIEQLWGTIEQRAQQCQPPVAEPNLSPITPEQVQRDLKEEGVNIGEYLNISLAWSAPVDLDLAVHEPGGTLINFDQKVTITSGTLDIDANRFNPATMLCEVYGGRNPIENISWNRQPPHGTYVVHVSLFSLCTLSSRSESIPFTLLISKAGEPPLEIPGEVSTSAKTFVYYVKLP